MLAKDLYDFRALLKRKRVIFCYSGYVTEAVLAGVGDALKQKMTIDEANTKTIRSVFAVFVEQMQNMIRYSAEKEPELVASGEVPPVELRYGVLAISHGDDGFAVEAGNLVLHGDVDPLRERLSRLAGADKDELRSLYKEQLKAVPEDTGKGAGIGLIEIARRASKPIVFDFLEVDDRFTFFTLKAEI